MDITTTEPSIPIKLFLKHLSGCDFRHTATLSPWRQGEKLREMSQHLNAAYCNGAIPNDVELKATLILQDYQKYVTDKAKNNPTYQFWNSYIEAVQLLLTFIRATRESNWNLHLASVRLMLGWYFACDMTNYARYLPVYWSEMTNLKQTHPTTYHNFTVRGSWTVQRTDQHGFSSLACDQAIEQTVNRDAKTKGGIKGITMNRMLFIDGFLLSLIGAQLHANVRS